MKIVQTNINKISYEQVDISLLSLDDILEFHIFVKRENNYVIIIEAGTLLTPKLYKMLQTKDALYASKKKSKKKPTHKTLFQSIQQNKNDFKKSINLLYAANNTLFSKFIDSKDDTIDIDSMNSIVESAVYLVQNNSNYLKDTMEYFSLDYSLAYHSLHVSLYAIHLGYFLKLSEKELTHLGIAGLLHDIGTKKVNESIKTKDSKLDFKETELIQQHAKYSQEIAQKNYIHDPYILDAIIHHHESHDGTGYPHKLISKDIKMFTSILSISDSFDALTNDRTYRKKYTSFEALKLMMQDETTINKFHQDYLRVFLQSLIK